MSDYIRPEGPRLREIKMERERRSRKITGGVAIAVVFLAIISPFFRTSSKNRASANHAAAKTNIKVFKPVPFAGVGDTTLALVLPVPQKDITGLGYHQAYNVRALPLISKMNFMGEATTRAVLASIRSGGRPAFMMTPRGRGSPADSSVDIAVKSGSVIKSPVTGRVLEVVPYLLYGRINDIRIEIVADGYPDFKIALVHMDNATVAAGQRVEAGKTPLATVRPLGISSQIDQYIGKEAEHVHIQANPIESEPSASHVD